MKSHLPIGVEELLSGAVETARLELKATWDSATTGPQIIRTLCAFANDAQNLNGGYLVVGVAERDGVAVRPAQGMPDELIAAAQTWIRGHCNQIDPIYMPVFDVVAVDEVRVLVIWAPASDTRPHQAPDGGKGDRRFWIREGSDSVAAKGDRLTQLMQQTARVPFDDRRAAGSTNEDLSLAVVQAFLHDVSSDLLHEPDAERVYRAMRIVAPVNGHSIPRNIGLLCFSNEPSRWFRGARIEVVEFPDEAGGNIVAERSFSGPLQEQVRQCLRYLDGLSTRHLEKRPSNAHARGWVSFPTPALREAIVNAVYHRGYEASVEPTKVYLYPDRIEIISYPGPVAGVEPKHFEGSAVPPPVPARNRRIGELLKELRLAESRGTGLPKIRRSMVENGSPPPRLDFDDDRTYFRVTLPAHPEYVALNILRDYAYAKATGDDEQARRLLEQAWQSGVRSPSVAAERARDFVAHRDLAAADAFVDGLSDEDAGRYARALTTVAVAHADGGTADRSKELLDRLPDLMAAEDAFDAAILERRLKREDKAHRLFERAGDLVLQDARALHEFAQAKLALAQRLKGSSRPSDQQARKRLLQGAVGYLERVTQMDAPLTRHAWAWFNLGQARERLSAPRADIAEAYEKAVALLPREARFTEARARANARR